MFLFSTQYLYWVRLSCIEHTDLFNDRIIDPKYVYDFLKTFVTTVDPPENVVKNFKVPLLDFSNYQLSVPSLFSNRKK